MKGFIKLHIILQDKLPPIEPVTEELYVVPEEITAIRVGRDHGRIRVYLGPDSWEVTETFDEITRLMEEIDSK